MKRRVPKLASDAEALLDTVKRRAAERGMPYQRFIREAVEQAVGPAGTKGRS